MINTRSPNIFFLSATKATIDHVHKCNSKLGQSLFSLSTINKAGCLALLWNNNIYISTISSNSTCIEACILLGQENLNGRSLLWKSHQHPKELSWNILKGTKVQHPTPWLVVGDLNLVLTQTKKPGEGTSMVEKTILLEQSFKVKVLLTQILRNTHSLGVTDRMTRPTSSKGLTNA